ncbi:hypothetical protein ACFO5O_01690 [Geojedonia litorea]|uniref:DUF4468 domain-containing protein n=1 Tax=Geojedonia litorea TaxID=1268269 RepID=A0ABV9N2N1_9FLAO
MTSRILNRLILLVILMATNISIGQNSEILLKTDFDGNVVEGSIQNLIDNIRAGEKIRVGWNLDFDNDGKVDLEHWIDANFLSILNGHVFNQIEPIYAQGPNIELPQIQIRNSNLMWTAIVGTNGKLISRFIKPDLVNITDENQKKQMELMTQINEELVETIWSKLK